MLAVWEAKEFWFTAGTLPTNYIRLALALATKAITLVVVNTAICITLAWHGTIVEQ